MPKKINMLGFQSGKLTVIEEDTPINGARWKCQCECGKVITVRGSALRGKKPPQSCGCERTRKLIEYNHQNNIKDISNQRFGSLIALKPTELRSAIQAVMWECVCDCGKTVMISGADLRSGNTRSCGCQRHKSSGEEKIRQILIKNNISFTQEYNPQDLYFKDTGYQARFDFYVDGKYIIEYDGRQHFIQGNGVFDNEEKFIRTQEHDIIKNQYCFDHNIPIIRIPYTELENITLEMLQPKTSTYLLREPGSSNG